MEEFYLVNGKILDVRTGKFIKADLKITGKQIASVQEKASTGSKEGGLQWKISDSRYYGCSCASCMGRNSQGPHV